MRVTYGDIGTCRPICMDPKWASWHGDTPFVHEISSILPDSLVKFALDNFDHLKGLRQEIIIVGRY